MCEQQQEEEEEEEEEAAVHLRQLISGKYRHLILVQL